MNELLWGPNMPLLIGFAALVVAHRVHRMAPALRRVAAVYWVLQGITLVCTAAIALQTVRGVLFPGLPPRIAGLVSFLMMGLLFYHAVQNSRLARSDKLWWSTSPRRNRDGKSRT